MNEKTLKDLIASLKTAGKPKTSAYDTTATVTRVENGTAWVHIPGGVTETPVKLTINAKAGDNVQVRVSGGRAFMVGNASAPPTDDTVATGAVRQISTVRKVVEKVREVAETSYHVSTTSTTTSTVATWDTGHSEIWTANKWVYVRIRDTAGKRNGYFYGSDQFFYNTSLANGSSPTYISTALRTYSKYSGTTITTTAATGTTGNGVWADYLYSDGQIRIRQRYNSTNSSTINGTFKVEVYLLDPPAGAPIF